MRATARGISLVALMSMLFAVMAIGPAFAQQANPYEPATESGEAEGPATVQPGVDATFFAGGFQPSTPVVVTITGVLSATATLTANAEGVATYVVTVPCDTASGTATVSFDGTSDEGAARTATTDFTVTEPAAACPAPGDGDGGAAAPDADEGGLAATGGEFTNGAALAVLALLVGAGFLIAGRRRSEDSVDA